jgi:hypothetical protein
MNALFYQVPVNAELDNLLIVERTGARNEG